MAALASELASEADWEALCARKRDEIERDTRLLNEQQTARGERLYRELEAAAAAAEPEDDDESAPAREPDFFVRSVGRACVPEHPVDVSAKFERRSPFDETEPRLG